MCVGVHVCRCVCVCGCDGALCAVPVVKEGWEGLLLFSLALVAVTCHGSDPMLALLPHPHPCLNLEWQQELVPTLEVRQSRPTSYPQPPWYICVKKDVVALLFTA